MENAMQLRTFYRRNPILRPVVKTGVGNWHDWNPLNTWHVHFPPKPGEQKESMQNWRPGEKMLGPDGKHPEHQWEPRQGPTSPPPPPGSNTPPLPSDFPRQFNSAHWAPTQLSQFTPSSSFFSLAG